MVKAIARGKDGRQVLVLGISAGNVDRLKQGQPIYFDMGQLHTPDSAIGHVTIFYGESELTLRTTLANLIGPDTEIIDIPQGPESPQ